MPSSQPELLELLTPDQFDEIHQASGTVATMSVYLARYTLLATVDGKDLVRETELSGSRGTMLTTLALFDEAVSLDQIHWRDVSIGYAGRSRNPGHVREPLDSDRRRFTDIRQRLSYEKRR